MSPEQTRTSQQLLQQSLDLLTSVVLGDAGKEDILEMTRRAADAPLESLNRLVSAFRRPPISTGPRRPRRPLNEHQPGEVPFVLNGTLYDPADVRRFNGQALHLVPAAGKDYLLAVDDLATMRTWWDLLRWAQLEKYQYGGFRWESPPNPPPSSGGTGGGSSAGSIGPQDHNSGGGVGPVSPWFKLSHLYEDANFEGDWLTTEINRGFEGYDYGPQRYPSLESVGRGFLGLGDWEDVISSVKIEHGVCILFENAYFGLLDGGSSATLTQSEPSLDKFGFNDKALSVDCF